MLLFPLTLAAILMSYWVLPAIIAGIGNTGKFAQPYTVLNKKVSLWSLLLFMFFPEFNERKSYCLPPQELN